MIRWATQLSIVRTLTPSVAASDFFLSKGAVISFMQDACCQTQGCALAVLKSASNGPLVT